MSTCCDDGEFHLVAVKRPWVPELLFAMFAWVVPYQPFRWVLTRPAGAAPHGGWRRRDE